MSAAPWVIIDSSSDRKIAMKCLRCGFVVFIQLPVSMSNTPPILDEFVRYHENCKPKNECLSVINTPLEYQRIVTERGMAYRRMILAATTLRTADYLAAKTEYKHWCRVEAKYVDSDNTGDDRK